MKFSCEVKKDYPLKKDKSDVCEEDGGFMVL